MTLTLSVLHFWLVSFRLDDFGLRDPIEITSEIVFDLLLLSELVEIAPRFCLFSLLRELTATGQRHAPFVA